MKCLLKYKWVKLPRDYPYMGKGIMAHWVKLASRAAFRKGKPLWNVFLFAVHSDQEGFENILCIFLFNG